MNILKTAVIAVLLGTMTIEEVQAVSLNKMHHKKHAHKKHHAKQHRHSLAQGEDADEAPAEVSPKVAAVADKETLDTKEEAAKLAALKDKKAELTGTVIVPKSEDAEAEEMKSNINKLANAADRNAAAKKLAKGEIDLATQKLAVDGVPKKQKEAELAKLDKIQAKVDALKKSVEDGKDQEQEEKNEGKDKEAQLKDLDKDIKEQEDAIKAKNDATEEVASAVAAKTKAPAVVPSKDAVSEGDAVKALAKKVEEEEAASEEKKEAVEVKAAGNANPAVAGAEASAQDADDEKLSAEMDTEAKADDKKAAAPKKLSAPNAAQAKECEGNFSKDECHTLNLPEHLAQVSAEGKHAPAKKHSKHHKKAAKHHKK